MLNFFIASQAVAPNGAAVNKLLYELRCATRVVKIKHGKYITRAFIMMRASRLRPCALSAADFKRKRIQVPLRVLHFNRNIIEP